MFIVAYLIIPFFRLEVALKENQTYESRLSALQATLKERSAEKSELALQVDELRESLRSVETQNVVLQENVEELHKEVEQLKNFAAPLRSKKSFGGFSTPNVGGYSVGDISVDDPQFSPLKDGEGVR
jgi:cell division protein FtsB